MLVLVLVLVQVLILVLQWWYSGFNLLQLTWFFFSSWYFYHFSFSLMLLMVTSCLYSCKSVILSSDNRTSSVLTSFQVLPPFDSSVVTIDPGEAVQWFLIVHVSKMTNSIFYTCFCNHCLCWSDWGVQDYVEPQQGHCITLVQYMLHYSRTR